MYLVSANSMSESQRRTDGREIAFFKAPVVFGLGKSIGITGERLHNSFFKDVLSSVIDKTIMLNDSIPCNTNCKTLHCTMAEELAKKSDSFLPYSWKSYSFRILILKKRF